MPITDMPGLHACRRERWSLACFESKKMANCTHVAAIPITASLIPISVLGHAILNANPHAFCGPADALGDPLNVA